jgi:hypothetical protein
MSDAADRLEAMAKRIRANKDDEFAGCICILPPASDDGRTGESIELLLIDPKRDPVNFWSTARGKLEIAANEFQMQNQRPNLGFR